MKPCVEQASKLIIHQVMKSQYSENQVNVLIMDKFYVLRDKVCQLKVEFMSMVIYSLNLKLNSQNKLVQTFENY